MPYSPPNEWQGTPEEFWAHLNGTVRPALALVIERPDGTIFGFTSAQRDVLLPSKSWGDVVIPEVLLTAHTGKFPTSLQQSRDLRKPDIWEFAAFTAQAATAYVKESEAVAGRFMGSQFSLRLYLRDNLHWQSLRQQGFLGTRTLDKGLCTWKMQGLSTWMQTEVLEVTSPLSRADWGDEELAFFNLNGNTIDGYAARVNTTVSAVNGTWPRRRFTLNSCKNFPAHRFTDGTVKWTSGLNSDFIGTVLDYDAAAGTFLLDDDTPSPIAVGQSVQAQIHCPVTREEWITFFGDAQYFAGEPGIPSLEAASSIK